MSARTLDNFDYQCDVCLMATVTGRTVDQIGDLSVSQIVDLAQRYNVDLTFDFERAGELVKN